MEYKYIISEFYIYESWNNLISYKSILAQELNSKNVKFVDLIWTYQSNI